VLELRSTQLGLARLALAPLALALLALLALGCGPRYARVPLVETADLKVTLRSEKKDGEPVERGFEHPATISAPRMESILSRIDVRDSVKDAEERRAAIPTELVPTLAAALADALARADSTQEVTLRAERHERKLGVFTRRFVTSFVAFVDAENRLEIHLVDADRELPAGEDAPIGDPIASRSLHAIKALPSPSMAALGQRGVAIDWRSDVFEAPPLTGGAGRRRTILMESPGAAVGKQPVGQSLPASDPERLRALADLEDARREGRISEAEYQRQRAALLRPVGN
jgi:hypothetical protein